MHPLKRFWPLSTVVLGAMVIAGMVSGCSDSSNPPTQRALSPGEIARTTYAGPNQLCKAAIGTIPTGPYKFVFWTEGFGTVMPGNPLTPDSIVAGKHWYTVQVSAGSCIDFYQAGSQNESVEISELLSLLPAGISFDHAACVGATGCKYVIGNLVHVEPFTGQVAVTFYNSGTTPPPPPTGDQGCTPGFWKNSTGSWPPTGLSTGAHYNDVFGVTGTFASSFTLLNALNARGGGADALARASTAALLSALHSGVDYPLTPAQIIAAVQAAFAPGGNIEVTKNLLDGYNNLGCPLANDNSFRD